MSDERRLEESDSNASQPRLKHNHDRSKEPNCSDPYPTHRPALKTTPPKKGTVKPPDFDLILFSRTLDRYVEESRSLLMRKQRDYGPLNIANAPGGALNGLRVRIFDKVSRINNLIDTGKTPENESLRDSFIDLANYGLIALMVLDGVWPELPEEKK